jgi:cell wall assembly regulator SMI1
MQQQLIILDKHLRTSRPDFYTELNDPLSDAEINALEQKYNRSLPADLRTLYKWKNGHNTFTSFVNNSYFIPLQEALESAADLTSMIGSDFEIENWWNQHWIPLFNNGATNYICYDMGGIFTGEPGQLIEYWNKDNDRNVIFPNLESFIEAINRFYENTSPDSFDEFFSLEINPEGFPKRFIVDKRL